MKKSAAAGSLERSSPVPLYHQIALHIREDLLQNNFEPGMQYYSDREVVRRYGVSLLTARQAVAQLVNEKLLERRRGSGTYVSKKLATLRENTPRLMPALLFVGWSPAELGTYEAMYFRDVYEGIRREATERGHHVLFDDTRLTEADAITADMKSRNIAGVVALIGSSSAQRVMQLRKAGLRAVAINFEIPQVPSLLPDDYGGARMAVKHLIELGHRRLAHLNSGESTPHWVDVQRGFSDECAAHGIKPIILSSELKRGSIDAGFALAQQLCSSRERPTAVFAGNDLMAIGAMKAFAAASIRVPQDISVIGFDNIEAAEICTPGLTTIGVDRQAVGRTAVKTVLDPDPPLIQRLGTVLVERQSTQRL
ncbi:MAG TPA: GntR family transcriptional regulator [Planctomycetota bacterium]|nr:GntR family transcriptional regulator [Planctomycetota bacterium]